MKKSLTEILGKRSPLELDASLQEHLFPLVNRVVGKEVIWANAGLVPRENHVEGRSYYRSANKGWDDKDSPLYGIGSAVETSMLLKAEDCGETVDSIFEYYYSPVASALIMQLRCWSGFVSPNLPVCVFQVRERSMPGGIFDLVIKVFFQLSRLTTIDIPGLSLNQANLEREIARHKGYRDAIAIALIAERTRRYSLAC